MQAENKLVVPIYLTKNFIPNILCIFYTYSIIKNWEYYILLQASKILKELVGKPCHFFQISFLFFKVKMLRPREIPDATRITNRLSVMQAKIRPLSWNVKPKQARRSEYLLTKLNVINLLSFTLQLLKNLHTENPLRICFDHAVLRTFYLDLAFRNRNYVLLLHVLFVFCKMGINENYHNIMTCICTL